MFFCKSKLMSNHFIIILLLSHSILLAQETPQDWQAKYWHYRARFLGDSTQAGFIELGEGAGCSLPASRRSPSADCQKDWHIVHKKCAARTGKGKINWSDATIYLGFYLTVISLEHENLKNSNADSASLQALKQEVWWALEAFERLDSMAEEALGLEGQKDGFFLRDDVSGDFHFKKEAKKQRRFGHDSICYDCIQSDYSCGQPSPLTGDFISQDQVLGLFIGFLAVQKFLGEEKLAPNLPSFGEKVAVNVDRILSYMLAVAWRLRTPSGQKIPNRWGGFAIGMSLPIAQAANRMTAEYGYLGKDFQDNYIRRGAGFQGRVLSSLLETSFSMQNGINQLLAILAAISTDDWSMKKIIKRSKKTDRIAIALLHAVLNDRPIPSNFKWGEIEQLLETAPWDGPCFNSPNCQAPDGWKSYDRWIHAGFKNGNPYGNKGEFVGLDYMLLYNLYHYLNNEKLPSYKNALHR